MSEALDRALLEHLEGFVTAERKAKMRAVLGERTRRVRVVLEDLYQPHNAAACLRSCDCLGIQEVHIIENRNRFTPNDEISLGADQWLDLHRHRQPGGDNTRACLEGLRRSGVRIAVTDLAPEAHDLATLPLDQDVALVFGTELTGVSRAALELADLKVRLPMYGFTQSYNVSVSCALALGELTRRLRAGEAQDWRLAPDDHDRLLLRWLKFSVKHVDAILRRYHGGALNPNP